MRAPPRRSPPWLEIPHRHAGLARIEVAGDSGVCYWRVYVRLPHRRVDRYFYDATYGGSRDAEVEARQWLQDMAALRRRIKDTGMVDSAADRAVDQINSFCDARIPRLISISIYGAPTGGPYTRLRFLVSDKGQAPQRYENAVGLGRVTLNEAFSRLRERLATVLTTFFGQEAATRFLWVHADELAASAFLATGQIHISDRLDRYLP